MASGSSAIVSESHGPVVDVRRFARLGEQVELRFAASALPRLATLVVGDGGEVQATVRGLVSDGDAFVELAVHGEVVLQCPRCLEPLSQEVKSLVRLRVVAALDAGPTEDDDELAIDDIDDVVIDGPLDLQVLVEDEVLLGLPMAPAHGQCDLSAGELEAADGEASSPFAALRALRRVN